MTPRWSVGDEVAFTTYSGRLKQGRITRVGIVTNRKSARVGTPQYTIAYSPDLEHLAGSGEPTWEMLVTEDAVLGAAG